MATSKAHRKEPYHGYGGVREIARVIKESQGEGNPYSCFSDIPFSEYGSLFSAVCGVLTIEDEERKKKLLGEQAYAKLSELYDEMARGNTELFREVYYEARAKRYVASSNPFETPTELVEPRPSDILKLIRKPSYSRRLLAAKIRKEFFPTEAEIDEEDLRKGLNASAEALFRRLDEIEKE